MSNEITAVVISISTKRKLAQLERALISACVACSDLVEVDGEFHTDWEEELRNLRVSLMHVQRDFKDSL